MYNKVEDNFRFVCPLLQPGHESGSRAAAPSLRPGMGHDRGRTPALTTAGCSLEPAT